MLDTIYDSVRTRMSKTLESLSSELSKLRSGRAHPSLLDQVMVNYYGTPTALNQVASVTVEDGRTLCITPWEKNLAQDIEKAIMQSDLGLNPNSAGTVIRVPMPALTEERRKDLIKVVRREGEQTRVALRNIRRDGLDDVKALLKDKDISEDDERRAEDQIKKIIDDFSHKVDAALHSKEQEMMQV